MKKIHASLTFLNRRLKKKKKISRYFFSHVSLVCVADFEKILSGRMGKYYKKIKRRRNTHTHVLCKMVLLFVVSDVDFTKSQKTSDTLNNNYHNYEFEFAIVFLYTDNRNSLAKYIIYVLFAASPLVFFFFFFMQISTHLRKLCKTRRI